MSVPNDPRRLLEYGDDLNGLLRGALDAERGSGPSAGPGDAARLERIGKRLAEQIGAPPPSPPASPPAAAPVTTSLALKGPVMILAAATLAGLVALGVAMTKTEAPTAEVPHPATTTTTAAPPPPPAEESPPSLPTVSPADLPSVSDRPTAPSKAAAPAPVKAARPSEADEIALLARAHDALRSNPADALALCREHEATFASGNFAQEREAVAIEALVYLHRDGEARRRFTEFERRYPTSSHRVHLASLLAH